MHNPWLSLVLWFLANLALQVLGDPIDSTVTINSGVVEGRPQNAANILEFLGIPFAAPPVGDLRWRAPQPVPEFDGNFDATAFGASCYSAQMGTPQQNLTSEDCLTVNVWTGSRATEEKRPVMVWIYGGGFQYGSSSQPNYNGTNLAANGVVLVSFNYRVGVLGFLGLSELDEEETNSGNYGLQDQVAALRWVQENISRFGGDPDNVTIFGESAGAHSVGLLLASPLASGLFHRAILESGAYWESEHGSMESFDDARTKGQMFQQRLGVDSAAELRSLSATEVNGAALWDASTDPGVTAFAPSVDEYIVPKVPSMAFDNRETHKVPILAGFNANEESLFLSRALPHGTPDEYEQSADLFFGSRVDDALQVYPGSTQANDSAEALVGDLVIRQQTFEALDRQALASGQTSYGYYFTYTSPYSPSAVHTAEINFVFGNLGPNPIFGSTPPPSAADFDMATSMMKYWTNFAKTGNPNGANDSLPNWPSYADRGGSFLQLGNEINAVVTPDAYRFEFIRSLRTDSALPSRWRSEFVNNSVPMT